MANFYSKRARETGMSPGPGKVNHDLIWFPVSFQFLSFLFWLSFLSSLLPFLQASQFFQPLRALLRQKPEQYRPRGIRKSEVKSFSSFVLHGLRVDFQESHTIQSLNDDRKQSGQHLRKKFNIADGRFRVFSRHTS